MGPIRPASRTVANGRNPASESLLAGFSDRVGKISVQGKMQIFDLRRNGLMKALDRIGTRRDMLECAIKLREVLELHSDMKFPELWRTEAELSAGKPEAFEPPFGTQVPEIDVYIAGKFCVDNAISEVAPDVINIDGPLLIPNRGSTGSPGDSNAAATGSPERLELQLSNVTV